MDFEIFLQTASDILEYHPDMNKSPGAEEKFKEISAAYEVYLDLGMSFAALMLYKVGFGLAFPHHCCGCKTRLGAFEKCKFEFIDKYDYLHKDSLSTGLLSDIG
eukprot:Gb_10995 [translate_table: standard]